MQALLEAIIAALTLWAGYEAEPPPAPEPIAVEVIGESPFVPQNDPYVDRVADDGGIVVESTDGIAGDGTAKVYSLGWITSPYTGRLVCVTGAPCEGDAAFTGPEVSSYNWITGEVN
jgi:hypothetical protein